MRQLDEQPQVQEQVGFADRLLLTKTDLVDAEQQARLAERLAGINPRAPLRPVLHGEVPLTELLDEVLAERAPRFVLVLFWWWLGWHFLVGQTVDPPLLG